MKDLFEAYKKNIEERLNDKPLLMIGEDSIRYDFFAALMEVYNLRPSQIHIEMPINSQCFIPSTDKVSYRKQKPLIDLVVSEPSLKIAVEFGLFRQNSNEDGTIDKTARLAKMLNDMIRVSLEAHFSNTKGYFICVADDKMLKHQLRSKAVDRFPSSYIISSDVISHMLTYKTKKIDTRFLNVFFPLGREIVSKLVVDERINAKQVVKETRILIWEVAMNN